MLTTKSIPADADGMTGWLHDCGAFVSASDQPRRCGVCRSALRNGQAHNGNWQPAHVIGSTAKEAS